jgi:hypothetical protein
LGRWRAVRPVRRGDFQPPVHAGIENRPLVTSVYVSDNTGKLLLLEQESGGGWQNRLVDIAKWGPGQRTLKWRGNAAAPEEDWHASDFDPRQRPWHIGAMSLARESDVYWSFPYRFSPRERPVSPRPSDGATCRAGSRTSSRSISS